MSDVLWPLTHNRIRRGMLNHTFGMVRRYRDGRRKPHQGWDFEASPGTPTFAIADGKVEFVRDHGDYGKQVCVSFSHEGETLYAFYAHLDTIFVSNGSDVTAGQKIATTGRTGNASGLPAADDHLHFEIREVAWAGRGLRDRRSPFTIYKHCPLGAAVTQIIFTTPMVITG